MMSDEVHLLAFGCMLLHYITTSISHENVFVRWNGEYLELG